MEDYLNNTKMLCSGVHASHTKKLKTLFKIWEIYLRRFVTFACPGLLGVENITLIWNEELSSYFNLNLTFDLEWKTKHIDISSQT